MPQADLVRLLERNLVLIDDLGGSIIEWEGGIYRWVFIYYVVYFLLPCVIVLASARLKRRFLLLDPALLSFVSKGIINYVSL